MGYLGLSSLVSNDEKLKSLTQISLHGLLQAFTLLLSGFNRTISHRNNKTKRKKEQKTKEKSSRQMAIEV